MSKDLGNIKCPSKKQVKEAMSRPEADPDLDDYQGSKKSSKRDFFIRFFITFLLILFSFAGGSLVQREVDKNNLKPQIIYEKGEQIVKYVERSKTPTGDFLMHLNPNVDPDLAGVIAKQIDIAADKYQLPRKLICAIIKAESNVEPFNKSHVGAVGLMQVYPKWHKERIGDRNIWHISVNIDVGCNIFRHYLDKENGGLEKTFHAYLSKNATKAELDKYTGRIYKYWSKLELYDYLSTQEREANKNGFNEPTPHSEQIDKQPVEPDLQKK